MQDTMIWLTIAGMGAVTYLPRLLPIWALSTRKLPTALTCWLSYVPAAVLAALLAPELLLVDGAVDLEAKKWFLLAAGPCFAVAAWTKSFFGVVAVGMSLVALARLVFGG